MTAGYFRAFLILNLHLVSVQSVKYALRGQSVSLTPDIVIPHDVTLILWKHNGDKVVEFNGNEEQAYDTYEARVTLDWHSADLTINALTYDDSGKYDLEAHSKKLLTSHFDLQVIDKVDTPTVSCEMKDASNTDERRKQATLRCSVDPTLTQSLVKFEWSSPGNKQSGSNLTISLGDEHDDKLYNCTVSNPLTTESTTFTAKDCYPDKGSGATIAGICVAVLTVIAAVLMLVFCKLRHKACFAKTDVEKAEGSENNQGNHDDRKALLDRVSTIPSHQPLGRLVQNDPNSMDSVKDQQESTKTGPQKEIEKLLDREELESNLFNNEEPNDELPVEMDNRIEDTQTSLFEESESEKETEDDQGVKTPPATDFSPAAAAAGPSLNNTPEEDTSESKANASLEQISRESREKAVEGSEKYSDDVKEDKKSTILQHQPEKTTEKMLNSGPIRSVGEDQEANEGSSNHAGDQENVGQVENLILVPESHFEHKQESSDVALEFVQDSDVDTKESKEPESMNAECEMVSLEQKEEETTPPKQKSGPNEEEEEGYSRDCQEIDERTQSMLMKEKTRDKATSIEAMIPRSPKQDSHDVAPEVQSSDSDSVGYEESGRLNEESEENNQGNHDNRKALLDRVSTIPSHQPLGRLVQNDPNSMDSVKDQQESTKTGPQKESEKLLDREEPGSNLFNNEEPNDELPVEMDNRIEDTRTSLFEESESEKETDDDQGVKTPPATDFSPAAAAAGPSLNNTPEEDTSESKANASLEQISRESREKAVEGPEKYSDDVKEDKKSTILQHQPEKTTDKIINSGLIRSVGEGQEANEGSSNHAGDQENVGQAENQILVAESHFEHKQESSDVALEFVQDSDVDTKESKEPESMNAECEMVSPEQKEEEATPPKQKSGPNEEEEGYSRDCQEFDERTQSMSMKEKMREKATSIEAMIPRSPKQDSHDVAAEVQSPDSGSVGYEESGRLNEESEGNSNHADEQEVVGQVGKTILESESLITLKQGSNEFAPESFEASHSDTMESKEPESLNEESEMAGAEHREEDTTPQKQTSGQNHADDQRNIRQEKKYITDVESCTRHKEDDSDVAPKVQSSVADSKRYNESESMNEESKTASPENKEEEATSQLENSGPIGEEGYTRQDLEVVERKSNDADDKEDVTQGRNMSSEAESPMSNKQEIHYVAPEVLNSDSETKGDDDIKGTKEETKTASPEHEKQETSSQQQNSNPVIKHGDSGESQKGNEGNSNHSDDQRNEDQDEKLTFEAESLIKHKEENYDVAPEVQSSDLDSKGYKESESMNEESKTSSPENKVEETTSQQQNSGPKEEEEKEGYARKDQDNQSNSDLVDDEGNVIQGKYMSSEAESPMNQKLEIQNVAPEVSDSDSETNGDTKNTNEEMKRASPEHEEQETTSQPQNSGMKEEENGEYLRKP